MRFGPMQIINQLKTSNPALKRDVPQAARSLSLNDMHQTSSPHPTDIWYNN